MISVFSIDFAHTETSLKSDTLSKAFLISSNNSFFNGCEYFNPFTHAGNLKLIWLTGN